MMLLTALAALGKKKMNMKMLFFSLLSSTLWHRNLTQGSDIRYIDSCGVSPMGKGWSTLNRECSDKSISDWLHLIVSK